MFIEKIECPDPRFLSKVFLNHASRVDELVQAPNKLKIQDSVDDWIVFQFLFKEGGFGYIWVTVGRESEEKIEVTCNLK
jgi:hypothetical protein